MSDKRWSESQRKREEARAAAETFWCSWGGHKTVKNRVLKEQFPGGTMCEMCQFDITENLRGIIFMPEMTAALRARERAYYEIDRTVKFQQRAWELNNPGETAAGIVYYIRMNGLVKIGFTTDLSKRSRAYPPGSELLATEPAGRYTERDRHQQFSRWLARGREWFEESDLLREHIAELVSRYGVPDGMMHKFREHDTPRKRA